MVKWQGFMSLPEQYEQLEQYIQDQNKIDRPSLSNHQVNDLKDKLIFKMYHDPTIEIHYFVEGYIKTKEGYIDKVDVHTQTLHLYEESGVSQTVISTLRNGNRGIDNLTLKTTEKLYKYAKAHLNE
ncbi:YolD-like family protein [Staphylococcus xylosus]|uniref:YolD-like family protein n=1 Tax=Staphylococcus xylosus TaxID=1288 RepID=UPI000E6A0A0A|nr:YolD-like family protein [Staphylococcus xylosus]RIM75643.1 YolD-like family protein [Staphylococcus xylosus]